MYIYFFLIYTLYIFSFSGGGEDKKELKNNPSSYYSYNQTLLRQTSLTQTIVITN